MLNAKVETESPRLLHSFLLTLIIDAKEQLIVASVEITGAYLHALKDKLIIM